MIGLLQRVSSASVSVDDRVIATIERGILVLVGVERDDSDAQAGRLVERLLGYRVFADADGKMNLSVRDVGGGVLLVPQFTLAADTQKGMRASFTPTAPPQEGERLFERVVALARASYGPVHTGCFGADMKVNLTNNGPVTFWLRCAPADS